MVLPSSRSTPQRSSSSPSAVQDLPCDAHTRFDAALLAGDSATWALDITRSRVVADANLARLFSVEPAAAAGGKLGVYLAALHPDDRNRVRDAIAGAIAGSDSYEVECRVVLADGRHRWLVARGRVERDAQGQAIALPGVVVDITARKQSEEALREQTERYRIVTRATRDAIWDWNLTTDAVWCEGVGELFGYGPTEVGTDAVWWHRQVHPDDRDRVGSGIQRVVSGSGDGHFWSDEYRFRRADGTYATILDRAYLMRDADGSPRRMIGAMQDVTEARQAEQRLAAAFERERLINLVGNAIRASALDPLAIQQTAVRALGEALGVDRCYYATYDHTHDQGEIGPDWFRPGLQSIAMRYRLSELPINNEDGYRQGRTQVINDIYEHASQARKTDPKRPTIDADDMVARGLRALIRAPLHAGPTMTALVVVMGDDKRVWTDDEVRLVEIIASQTHAALEAARALARERTRAEQERLLHEIGDTIRGTLDPDEVQARATALLGRALNVDRCYFALYDPTRPVFRVGRDFHSFDIPSMAGEYALPTYASVYAEMYAGGQMTSVYNDVSSAPLSPAAKAVMQQFQITSLLGVALLDEKGAMVAALRAAMTDGPRVWSCDEITLVEQVATLVRGAMEAARVQTRERNIAQTLQRALQPPPPPDLPGLKLQGYYRPALDEAEVGGDFYDVFPLDKNCTALVVADLSGKGLTAASAVATCRNMCRYALYNRTRLADAITDLSRTLTTHDLLGGFATLFAGVYDQSAGTLTYVNCGQESGLLWRRATTHVEELPATGPVIGGFIADGDYNQRTVTLCSGDVFALFTDGLTEVGPNRRSLLEVQGVGRLLQTCCATSSTNPDPNELVPRLIESVDAFARGGVRDDIALLMGAVA